MTSASPDGAPAPTALRIRLGAQLRRLRQQRKLTREAAGWEIRSSESKISRMELGRVPFKERDVADLLTLYGVGDQERAALLALARQANAPGWWQRYGDVVPAWFGSYLGLEQAASLIRTYDLKFVPGLLQTADYARAVLRLLHPHAPEAEIDRRIELRRDRQRLLLGAGAPRYWAVLDEAVLRRRIGGPDVMRAQVEALLDAAERPGIRLQIASFRNRTYAAAGFPFAILRFAEPELPDLVYVEQLTGAVYLDKPGDVEHYVITMEHACVEAEAFDHSAALLREALLGIG
jgi:Domain of unknown function (DUF5753)/Helix-turn-helix domain